MAKPKPPLPPAPSSPFGGIAGLDALRSKLPAGERPPVEAKTAPDTAPSASTANIYNRAPRLVVRRERKGHGGKTATRIEGLRGSASEIESALKELKRTLGCGAARDGDDVVVQGDQSDRLIVLLQERGARKVVKGS